MAPLFYDIYFGFGYCHKIKGRKNNPLKALVTDIPYIPSKFPTSQNLRYHLCDRVR